MTDDATIDLPDRLDILHGHSAGVIRHLARRVAELEAEAERMRIAFARESDEIEQALGKAMGYPPLYPDASDVDDDRVGFGDHVAATLAAQAAEAIGRLKAELARVTSERDAAREALRLGGEPPIDLGPVIDRIIAALCWRKGIDPSTDDTRRIGERYAELRRTMSFGEAERAAKAEGLARVVAECIRPETCPECGGCRDCRGTGRLWRLSDDATRDLIACPRCNPDAAREARP